MDSLPNPQLVSPKRGDYFRIIPSQFPPIGLFEEIYESDAERAIAFEIEALTNPRLRAEAGDIHMVPKGEWVTGAGASIVMAAFTHIGNPSRFTDGSFGVYYAAESIATAIAETKYHRARFLASTQESDQEITMRVYAGRLKMKTTLHDLRPEAYQTLMDPDDYGPSSAYGAQLRQAGSPGVLYPSVRRKGGECVGIFRPTMLAMPKQRMHLRYLYRATSESITEVVEIRAL